ncbi:MAG: NADH-quinone oxidoreductase subunit J [Burkholderiaceae bacterium]
MEVQTLLFYLFAAVTVVSGTMVVTARNPVHSALFLVLTFVSAACIWMLLKAEFLAITLVLVYVGAVMVLFLFVVMMIDIDIEALRAGFWKKLPMAGIVAAIIVLELTAVLWHSFNTVPQTVTPPVAGFSNTKVLGQIIYSQYIYPVEIAAVLLLLAMVAAIGLTLRKRKDSRYNNPSKAVRTRAQDRVRVLKMPPTPRESLEISPPAETAEAAPANPAAGTGAAEPRK